jgi:hypothetical protein
MATEALTRSLSALASDDPVAANEVLLSKDTFIRKAEALRLRMGRHLAGGGREALDSHRLTVEHVENLKRIHTLSRRIARLVLDARDTVGSSRRQPLPAVADGAVPTSTGQDDDGTPS